MLERPRRGGAAQLAQSRGRSMYRDLSQARCILGRFGYLLVCVKGASRYDVGYYYLQRDKIHTHSERPKIHQGCDTYAHEVRSPGRGRGGARRDALGRAEEHGSRQAPAQPSDHVVTRSSGLIRSDCFSAPGMDGIDSNLKAGESV